MNTVLAISLVLVWFVLIQVEKYEHLWVELDKQEILVRLLVYKAAYSDRGSPTELYNGISVQGKAKALRRLMNEGLITPFYVDDEFGGMILYTLTKRGEILAKAYQSMEGV